MYLHYIELFVYDFVFYRLGCVKISYNLYREEDCFIGDACLVSLDTSSAKDLHEYEFGYSFTDID